MTHSECHLYPQSGERKKIHTNSNLKTNAVDVTHYDFIVSRLFFSPQYSYYKEEVLENIAIK